MALEPSPPPPYFKATGGSGLRVKQYLVRSRWDVKDAEDHKTTSKNIIASLSYNCFSFTECEKLPIAIHKNSFCALSSENNFVGF